MSPRLPIPPLPREDRPSDDDPRRLYGVFPARVTDNADPEGLGRLRVASGAFKERGLESTWARHATLTAGDDRGSWFVPEVDDEVLVCFEAGDPRRPYVLGALWNGQDRPPATSAGGDPSDIKILRSRSGLQITLDDTDGSERLVLETPGGQVVRLDDGAAEIEIADGSGHRIRLDAEGVTITSPTAVKIEGGTLEVSAASVTVAAATATFSGIVQADTVIAETISGTTYTPGTGNLL